MFHQGQLISYGDMANPRTTFVVVKVNDNPWSTYELRNLDASGASTFPATMTTDGRQAGWKAVA